LEDSEVEPDKYFINIAVCSEIKAAQCGRFNVA
jgi:hypothetical protein